MKSWAQLLCIAPDGTRKPCPPPAVHGYTQADTHTRACTHRNTHTHTRFRTLEDRTGHQLVGHSQGEVSTCYACFRILDAAGRIRSWCHILFLKEFLKSLLLKVLRVSLFSPIDPLQPIPCPPLPLPTYHPCVHGLCIDAYEVYG